MTLLSPLVMRFLLASVLLVLNVVKSDLIRGAKMVEVDHRGVRHLMGEMKGMAPKTLAPTTTPSESPTPAPSVSPQPSQSFSPSAQPSVSSSPTEEVPLSYTPGDFSFHKTSDDGLLRLSNGLSCKRIATSGEPVPLSDGSYSTELFHDQPDGAAVFPKEDGGWYYVSNAENSGLGTSWQDGGVGSIEFDANGNVVGYQRVASYLKRNCGGGATPWGSWITCEEITENDYRGKVYQVSPSGSRTHQVTSMGSLGSYESFTYDDSTQVPTFYVTRDDEQGVLTRFTPNAAGMECYNRANDNDRWCTLNNGSVDYLLISGGPSGTFYWTTNYNAAARNAKLFYPNAEGIDAADGKVFFVSKELKRLVILDLAAQRYTYGSTESGAFNHQPDQVSRLVEDDESVLYFCEDGGETSGVHGRTADGTYFTIIEGRTDLESDETTGLAWCRNSQHMYITYQQGGFVYDCTRDDGRPFFGETLDIKYHAV